MSRRSSLAMSHNMQVNDDAAERAARRRSAHFAPMLPDKDRETTPSSAAHKSALAVQKRAKRLSAVAPSNPPVSMEVMNTNFEEWMKLATDNKITATNTWNFALIDYFHDLTLLRNAEDESINFQKASCTLDGCVKIWTSRVDSVATETGKLLSGLAGAPEEQSEDEDGEAAEPRERERRRAQRSEATLAKSFAALQVKKFDLEFTVDPLFKKTSADFDEGGAMGLLMNHLGVDGTGRVVFDSGDALVEEDSDDEDEQEEEERVDIARLRDFLPPQDEVAGLNISDTLNGFYFAADPKDTPDLLALLDLDGDDDAPEPAGEHGEAVDFFGDDDYDAPAYDAGGGFDDAGDISMGGADDPFTAPPGSAPSAGPFGPGHLVTLGGAPDGNMFEYFDSGFGKAWAGAEHWKLKRVTRRAADADAPREKREKKAPFTISFAPEGKVSSRELFATSSTTTQLPKRKQPKRATTSSRRRDEHLLPDDMHFSSRQLLRLFLKPRFALRTRRVAQANERGEIDEAFWAQAAQDRDAGDYAEGDAGFGGDMPFESQFFHDDDDYVDAALDVGAEDGDADDLRLETQGLELRRARPDNVHYAKKAKRVDVKRLKDDIWSDLRAGLKMDAPEFEPESDRRLSEAAEAAEMPPPPPPDISSGTDGEPGEAATFDRVINSLRASYPRDKMSEISTSFCFICLLHLANEEGLKIETARSDGHDGDAGMKGFTDAEGVWDVEGVRAPRKLVSGAEVDGIVGELQALRVFRDPTAGRAA